MIRNKYVLLSFRLIVGAVFIWAGLLKILDVLGFAQSIANYRIFPLWMSFFLALALPWIEVICGAFLVFGFFRRSSALLLSGLLAAFLVLVIITIARGLDVDCGCFGSFNRKVDYMLLITDCILLFFSLNVFFSAGNPRR